MKKQIQFAYLLLTFVASASAFAHEFTVPESVTADVTGHFEFPVVVEITSPAEFGSIYVNGTDNTDLGEMWADGFCMMTIQPGTSTTMVEGNLTDQAIGGSVIYHHSMCDGWNGEGVVLILPNPVTAEPTSWSRLKAIYR